MNFLVMFEGMTKPNFHSVVKEIELHESELPFGIRDTSMKALNDFLTKKYDLVNINIHRIKTKGENKND